MLVDLAYARNGTGRIDAVASATGVAADDGQRSWSYGYDGFDRLILADRAAGGAADRAYRYDDAGNMVYNSGLACGTADNLGWRTYRTQDANYPIEFLRLHSLPANRPSPYRKSSRWTVLASVNS